MAKIVFHEYKQARILCGEVWYPVGKSPCEQQDADAARDRDELPACEREDADAAARLMGTSRCRFKPRGSWGADTEQCDPQAGTHTTPHRGCALGDAVYA